jgi:hypothetical protein
MFPVLFCSTRHNNRASMKGENSTKGSKKKLMFKVSSYQMPSVTCTSILLWMIVEVLQQSIYMWIQFTCPKTEKQYWFFMIIDCTQIRYSSTFWSNVVVNYLVDTRKDRWENKIDNRKTYIVSDKPLRKTSKVVSCLPYKAFVRGILKITGKFQSHVYYY